MPQAFDELRAVWRAAWRHGDPDGGEFMATRFLFDQGYKMLPGWRWSRPTSDHKPTERETSAIRYLIYEWNYGGAL